MSDVVNTTRVRGSFSTTAKGLAQLDITTEAETPEQMSVLMNEAFDRLVSVLKSKNVKLAHEVE